MIVMRALLLVLVLSACTTTDTVEPDAGVDAPVCAPREGCCRYLPDELAVATCASAGLPEGFYTHACRLSDCSVQLIRYHLGGPFCAPSNTTLDLPL